jgi:hypothetical protein
MSNRGAAWMGYVSPTSLPNIIQLAVDTAVRIAERPETIIVSRDILDASGLRKTIQLAPQTVRVEVVQSIRGVSEANGVMVSTTKQYTVILGYKDHPTIPNTNILRADRFYYQGRIYDIVELIDTVPGRLLVSAELKP